MTARPEFDVAAPPAAPPPGCGDPLLWQVAQLLHAAHAMGDVNGFCCACRAFAPCPARRCAAVALLAAFHRRGGHRPADRTGRRPWPGRPLRRLAKPANERANNRASEIAGGGERR